MKKIITFLIFFFGSVLIVNAKVTESENPDYIETIKYYKTVTMINANSVQTLNASSSSYNVEITQEEYENYNSNQNGLNTVKVGYTESNYKKMTTTITKVSDSLFRLKVLLEWKTMPATRSYDIIGIGFPNTITATSSTYFEQKYCLNNGSCNTRTSHSLYKATYGVGASFALPTDDIKSLSQSLSVDVKKSSSNTLTSFNVSGDYSHAQKSISQANSKKYTVNLLGINLDSSITNYYDSINAATALWTGTW